MTRNVYVQSQRVQHVGTASNKYKYPLVFFSQLVHFSLSFYLVHQKLTIIFMAALWNSTGHYIFAPRFLSSFFLFFLT